MNYDQLASKEAMERTLSALTEHGFLPEMVETKEEALSRVRELIPQGASVMNGASRTLEEIGFVNLLKEGNHGWKNLHDAVLAEKDPAKQSELRKQSVLSDFYLGSVHAVSESGELVVASNSGSQLPHLAFTSQNLILVVGAQKITPDLTTAMARLQDHVFPLEDKRMKSVGMGGSYISKTLIMSKEQPFMGRKAHVIFVNEKLGF
jgi:L-lactate utilization protein LutC